MKKCHKLIMLLGSISMILVTLSFVVACAKPAPAPAPAPKPSLAPAPAPVEVKWPETIRCGVVVASGTTYVISQAMGEVVKKHTPAKYWTGLPLGGIGGFGPEFQKGEMETCFLNGPSLSNLLYGINDAKEIGPAPVRTLLAAQPRGYIWYARPQANIHSVADLKGKRAYTAVRGNPFVKFLSMLHLEAAGLKEADLKASLACGGREDAMPDLIEGKVDAWFYPEIPELVMEMNRALGEIIVVPVTKEQGEFILSRQPGLLLDVLPAGRNNVKREVKYVMSYYNVLAGWAGLHPELAYGIVKAIWEHRDEWVQCHPQAKEILLQDAVNTGVFVYHEGAIKYYKEKGLWTDEAQKWQDGKMKELKALGLVK